MHSWWAHKYFDSRKCRKRSFSSKNPPRRPHSLIREDGVVVQGELSLDPMAQLRRDIHCLWRKEFSSWSTSPDLPPDRFHRGTRATYLCGFGLVLLHNEVAERMVLPNKENVTAKAVPSAWKNDGNGAGVQREGRNAANQQPLPW